jgi:hypothetical protein
MHNGESALAKLNLAFPKANPKSTRSFYVKFTANDQVHHWKWRTRALFGIQHELNHSLTSSRAWTFFGSARAEFLKQLSGRQRAQEEARREHIRLEDTVKSLSQAKCKAEAAYGTKFQGKAAEIKLSRVLRRLDIILRVGDDAMKFAPAAASSVWAAFRVVASGITQDFDACQFLVDAVDQISKILLLCEVYAKRQLPTAGTCDARVSGAGRQGPEEDSTSAGVGSEVRPFDTEVGPR